MTPQTMSLALHSPPVITGEAGSHKIVRVIIPGVIIQMIGGKKHLPWFKIFPVYWAPTPMTWVRSWANLVIEHDSMNVCSTNGVRQRMFWAPKSEIYTHRCLKGSL